MTYTESYDRIVRMENIMIYRQFNEDTEEWEIKATTNVTLAGTDITRGYADQTVLTPAQETAVIAFAKQRLQALGTELDVDIPAWAEA